MRNSISFQRHHMVNAHSRQAVPHRLSVLINIFFNLNELVLS